MWENFAVYAPKYCNYIGRLGKMPGVYQAPGCIPKSEWNLFVETCWGIGCVK